MNAHFYQSDAPGMPGSGNKR
ncbi:MAG: hypothetical protein H6P98_1752, partial [Candidatus Aminicenantes bacterium]|nr:hypothetical protein [Candidatus Aminicenantes bacterium]